VDLVVHRLAFFATVSPKRCWIPEREQAEAAHVPEFMREAGCSVLLLHPVVFLLLCSQ